jgi:hypothetical protein
MFSYLMRASPLRTTRRAVAGTASFDGLMLDDLQRKKLHLRFALLDTDGEGAVTEAEMPVAAEQSHRSRDPEAAGNRLFGPR